MTLDHNDDIAASKAANGQLDFDDLSEPTASKQPTTTAGKSPARQGRNAEPGLITVQPLKRADMQPSYAQDLGVEDIQHGLYGSLISCLGAFAGGLGQFPCCFCCPNPFHEIQQGKVGLVTRFGQFYKAVDPGLVQVNPCSENVKQVDVKITLTKIPTQTVMTKDNVNVQIDSVLTWHVVNPYRAVYQIENVKEALIERAQTTLRDVVGSRPLQSLVSDREGVALQVEEIVESVAERWGVQVESILIKDIIFSRELQESLASAATQSRIGQAKIVASRAEVESAKLMRQAADVLASPAALQLRELDALQAMAKSAGTKVVFVPMNLGSGQLLKESGLGSVALPSAGGSGAGSGSTSAAAAGPSGTGAGAGAGAVQSAGPMNIAALNQLSEM